MQHYDSANEPKLHLLVLRSQYTPSLGAFLSQYIIKTVEVDSAKMKQALCESQSRNQYLQEQVGMQRQVLKEMEQQLQNSQKTETQLRAQV